MIDGEHVADLESGDEVEIRFRDDVGRLAQLPGGNFYRRIGEKFGRLARGRRGLVRPGSSGAAAGPFRTSPSGSKREPWHGQSHVASPEFQRTMQPRCVQRAETRWSSPSQSRHSATWRMPSATTAPFAGLELGRALPAQPPAEEAHADVGVLLEQIGRRGLQVEPVRVEHLAPRIGIARQLAAEHLRRRNACREPPLGEAGRDLRSGARKAPAGR